MADHRAFPSITQATTDDIPEILAMIRELASYEKAEDKVEATAASLQQTLTFAPGGTRAMHTNSGYAKCLILRLAEKPASSSTSAVGKSEEGAHSSSSAASSTAFASASASAHAAAEDTPGAVAGMAIYFNNYSTWRSRPGIYLEDLFVRPQYRKRGYGKLLLQYLAQQTLRIDGARLEWCCLRWNESSLKFYDSIGAKQMGDWVGLRVDGEELVKLAGWGGGK